MAAKVNSLEVVLPRAALARQNHRHNLLLVVHPNLQDQAVEVLAHHQVDHLEVVVRLRVALHQVGAKVAEEVQGDVDCNQAKVLVLQEYPDLLMITMTMIMLSSTVVNLMTLRI